MLTITIAWDNALSWSWETAINELQATVCKVSAKKLCLLNYKARDFVKALLCFRFLLPLLSLQNKLLQH